MEEDEAPERQSIYMRPTKWLRLRTLGMGRKASASAQIDALVDHYLDEMSPKQQAKILDRAESTTRGRRGRVSE